MMDDFVGKHSWFEQAYRDRCGGRFATLKLALNWFVQTHGQTIVETGCVRHVGDFGAGYSTVLFAELLYQRGGFLFSVDCSPTNVELASRLTDQFASARHIITGDSRQFLQSGLVEQPQFKGQVDLLYLDSYDYPIAELEYRYTPFQLRQRDDETIATECADLVSAPQAHCLAELQAAWPYLHSRSIVLMDDNDFPGGGKPRLAKQRLAQAGWICLLDLQQTVWVPPVA